MTPQARESGSRALAVALALAVVGAIGFGIGVPATQWVSQRLQEQRVTYSRLARATAHAREHDPIAKQLQELDHRDVWKRLYVNQTNEVAIAALQTEVRSALGKIGPTASVEVMKPGEGETLTELRARFRFSAPANEVADALSALTSTPHWLQVRELKLSSPVVQSPDRNEPVEVSVLVVGFRVPGKWESAS